VPLEEDLGAARGNREQENTGCDSVPRHRTTPLPARGRRRDRAWE
jgi:hypothetical protein